MNKKRIHGGAPTGRRLLNIQEASDYIGLQVDTIYRMVSQRRKPFVKVGRRTKFDIDLLNDWLDEHTVMSVKTGIDSCTQ
jgi:excisionase family DNA binding protein